MTFTVKIEGMSCQHCVRAVKNALEALPGVTAQVTLEDGRAVVNAPEGIGAAQIKAAIEEEDYSVVEIA